MRDSRGIPSFTWFRMNPCAVVYGACALYVVMYVHIAIDPINQAS